MNASHVMNAKWLRDEHEDQAVRAHLDSAEPVNLLDDELGLELGPQ